MFWFKTFLEGFVVWLKACWVDYLALKGVTFMKSCWYDCYICWFHELGQKRLQVHLLSTSRDASINGICLSRFCGILVVFNFFEPGLGHRDFRNKGLGKNMSKTHNIIIKHLYKVNCYHKPPNRPNIYSIFSHKRPSGAQSPRTKQQHHQTPNQPPGNNSPAVVVPAVNFQ